MLNNISETFINKSIVCFDREEKLFAICPTCYSKNLKMKVRKLKNRRYYYCKNCQQYIYKIIKIDIKGEKTKIFCPYCHKEALIRKGNSHKKRKVYFCTDCNKHTVEPVITKEVLKNVNQLFCGICQSDKLKKKGFNKVGKQVYYCFNCQKRTVKVTIAEFCKFLKLNGSDENSVVFEKVDNKLCNSSE